MGSPKVSLLTLMTLTYRESLLSTILGIVLFQIVLYSTDTLVQYGFLLRKKLVKPPKTGRNSGECVQKSCQNSNSLCKYTLGRGRSNVVRACYRNIVNRIVLMEYNLFSFRHKKKLLLPLNLSNFYFYSFFTSYPALNCYLHKAQPQHSRLQQHFLNDVIRIFDFDREIDRAVLPSNRARKAEIIRYFTPVVEKILQKIFFSSHGSYR